MAERALDVLRCPHGVDHNARMEWQEIGGLRTGGLIAWCHTCDAPIPRPKVSEPPPDTRRHKRRPYIREYMRGYRQRGNAA